MLLRHGLDDGHAKRLPVPTAAAMTTHATVAILLIVFLLCAVRLGGDGGVSPRDHVRNQRNPNVVRCREAGKAARGVLRRLYSSGFDRRIDLSAPRCFFSSTRRRVADAGTFVATRG